MIQPFTIAQATLDAYRRYVRSSFPLRDERLDRQREALIDQGLLWSETFVSLARPGRPGPKLASLTTLLLERTLRLPWGFEELYEHQHRAIQRLAPARAGGPRNTLILSGTGSGKTEAFLIPIIDACLRNPGPGVKAVVIYPMNALANDQLKRLNRLLSDCQEVTFGRYTGDAPETDAGDAQRSPRPADLPQNFLWSRQAMRQTPPNILLTNYVQLEYVLLRGKDRELFRFGPPRYVVVDEIHLFTGILGAEVACLIRRLRQHTGVPLADLCMVGTSATAGPEEEARLLEFAARLFGAPFDADSLVAETPAPLGTPGPTTPTTPDLTEADLIGAQDILGLSRLAKKTFGIDLPASESLGGVLGEVIDQFRTVADVEQALVRPAPLWAAAEALGKLPERAGASREALGREARAILLLGTSALLPPAGEGEPQPRFRPRIHQAVRSPVGLWRCLDPACGTLLKPGSGRCPRCGSAAIPLASCRTCGEVYWTSSAPGIELTKLERLLSVEPGRGAETVFLTDPGRMPGAEVTDEEGDRVVWEEVRVCPACAAVAAGGARLAHLRACPRPAPDGITLTASTDNVHCPSCGDLGARNRPILLPLRGGAAASVAVLTQALSDQLRTAGDEAAGRLLVFADSRQDAAQQAGYSHDHGARVAVRQLLNAVLRSGPRSLPAAVGEMQSKVLGERQTFRRWLVGEAERRFAEIANPEYEPSTEDEDAIRNQLAWEVVLEVTERARRRFSLEQEGVIVVSIDRLDELVAAVRRGWPDHPFGSDDRLRAVIEAASDVLRYGRAVDHRMLRLPPRALARNHRVRIGDRGVTATRGYADSKYRSVKAQVDIRSWTADRYATRLSELIGRVLKRKPTDANAVVKTLASRLHAAGLLAESRIEGRKRYMIDHKRLVLASRADRHLWRCDRCGTIRAGVLTGLDGMAICANWRCPGRPEPYEPKAERDFYREQYLAPPRRLIVREHSAQVEAEERLALEDRFNDRARPTVDVLACTPTLEVGVSLDDLYGVILRNLPPTPANYAQRTGRAGRRSKVALAIAHAGQGPHDSYFFERPEELIAGLVRAPRISLENEQVLRRHVNSLIMEVLRVDLPERWVPPFDDPEFEGPTVADADGVLRESTLRAFEEQLADPTVRRKLREAVQMAFASPEDPAPPAANPKVLEEQLSRFLTDLRASLNRWCIRYRALREELRRLRAATPTPSRAEKEHEDQLLKELQRMAAPTTPEHRSLGFLGLVGFLPRYGFTGQSVLLHPPGGQEPLVQAAWVAVTEYAPANIVYARGRRLKVRRLDPPPVHEAEAGAEHRENVLRQGRRCDDCAFLTFDPLVKACPTCGHDLLGQAVIELTGVWGSGGAISSEDEFRQRWDYDVLHALAELSEPPEVVPLGGLTIERSSGREIILANRGPAGTGGNPAQGFRVCTGCGFSEESAAGEDEEEDVEVEGPGHAPRCPGRTDRTGTIVRSSTWLTARIRGDVLEILLPEATQEDAFRSWRATLAEGLKLGIRETALAGPRDLSSFERRRQGRPWSIVIYDTMPGGTGFIPKLLADGGEGLKHAAAATLARLEACECTDSCYRCLRDFWNQRIHGLLNRFEVFSALRRLAAAHATPAAHPEDERLESFLEQEFFRRLREASLPEPTLQVVRELGGQRIMRVDAEYRDPDISIFLDGRAYHAQSLEKIVDDLYTRNRLEAQGVCVLEFTYHDVMERFATVVQAIKGARERPSKEAIDPRMLPGVTILEANEITKRAKVAVDATKWLRDETARETSLASANRLRLAGWRLHRAHWEIPPDGIPGAQKRRRHERG